MLIVGKEKVSARDVIILILLQFALLITITGENINFDKVNLLGIIYSLSASIFYGLYLILAEDKAKHINGGVFSFFLILWGLVFMLFDYNILYQPQKITEINIDSIFWVVMLAIFSTILPVYLLNEGMRKIGSSKAAATTILNPAFAILLAFLIFNEEFDRIQLIGISMIIALIYLFNRKKKTI